MKKIHGILLCLVIGVGAVLLFGKARAAGYNYPEALLKAVAWFDANRCGKNVATDNVFNWRSACHTADAVDGGFHDAGDHVKFGLPAAFSASALGWSLYEFKSEFDNAGATEKCLQELKIFSDYFLKCWDGSSFVYQIGDGGSDHAYWGPPEDQTTSRPVSKATSSAPASDVCAQTAGALALMYLNYKSVDSAYANNCLSTAKELFVFAKTYLGKGSAASGYYNSTSYYDDLSWAAIWLSVATGDQSYLDPVDGWLDQKNDSGDDNYQKQWTYCWDDSTMANLVMMYKLTGKEKYYQGIIWNFDWYSNTLTKTSYGLPYLDNWAVLRYDSAEAGLMYIMYKNFGVEAYNKIANLMIDYCLGENPKGLCYLTNYGSNSVKHPHHRANEPNRDGVTKGMVGALAGGPDSGDNFTDDVNQYTYTEVALDYNASFLLGCAGRSYVARGGAAGTPMPTPTPAETSAPGTGTGLDGQYYSGTSLAGTALLKRVDATIDFEWGGGSPASDIPSDGFSVRWTGEVEARSTETYTFYLSHDDGARMWVNDVLVIDNWTDHAAVEDSGTIKLEIGRKYAIVVEFYENSGDASCQLSWSTNTIAKEIIPQSQLYNNSVTVTPTVTPSTPVSASPTATPTATSTATSTPTTACSVAYSQNDWGSGATVSITIKNNGATVIDGWELAFSFAGNQEIINMWNGTFTQNGADIVVTDLSYNSAIPAGGTVSFGFNLSYSGTNATPANFTVNGSSAATY
ncbi:MAG: glycoside hydrolase family 9 protein [Bacillota bacterium]